jgi:DNA-binding SARP family transcriptional activator
VSEARSAGGSAVWLRLVGPFEVWRGGEPLADADVGNRKARTLLAMLAVQRDRLVGTDNLADALWDGVEPRNPVANLATLVSRLRSTLGTDVINGGKSGYQLGKAVGTDLHQAAALVGRARAGLASGQPALAVQAARSARDLLDGGPVVADVPDATWLVPARTWQAELLRRARLVLSDAALRAGDPAVARDAAQAAVGADPLDETAVRALMRAFDAAGEPARALVAFERLRITLERELGVNPAGPTRDVYVAIRRNVGESSSRPALRHRVQMIIGEAV